MKKVLLIFVLLLVFAAAAIGGYFGYEAYSISTAPPVSESAAVLMSDAMKMVPTTEPESAEAKALKELIKASWSFELGQGVSEKRDAVQAVSLTVLDTDTLFIGLQENAQAVLQSEVENAKLSWDVYNEDYSYKNEILDLAANDAFKKALENAGQKKTEIELKLRYEDKKWSILNIEDVYAVLWPSDIDLDKMASEVLEKAVENPQYVRKTYFIEENAKKGPEPDRSKFGSTSDPAVIEALIATPMAQQLINGQELVWNRDIPFIPGTEILYYLDETILSIVWQEPEALAVGTFSETFIADGSQLRRKIAGDRFEDFNHDVATAFAAQTNSVLALGGDLYHHDRSCGIMVYEREIYRFDPYTCDTCYFTPDGDMLFSYRGQFSDISEAEAFVEENDILFSLCFGPVLIDDGQDVCPETYPWGEVNDTYARSALGMLGEKHYLSVNINCKQPDYYYLATLRNAADAMINRGCIKAYTLDGGQTASTIFNNQLINPVQFGWERPVSDIIYFATAVPN